MKTRWKVGIVIAIFLLLGIGVGLMDMHLRPENALDAYKKSLRDRGEKLEISEVLPPPVAPESNGVDLVKSAFSLLPAGDEWSNQPSLMHMIAPGKALIGWQQPDLRDPEPYGYTNSWSNALAYAASNRPAIELLRQAASYPAIDFGLDYQKVFDILLPHLGPLKFSVELLGASAMCDLHSGDAASATTNLCTMLSLIEGDHDERLLISQLIRMAMLSFATGASWELLQSTNLTDADLAHLQLGWERMEFIQAFENSTAMQRARQEIFFRQLRVSNSEFHRLLGGFIGSGWTGWTTSGDWLQDAKGGLLATRDEIAVSAWRAKWSYSDELLGLKHMQITLETLRTIETNQLFLPAYNDMISRTDTLSLTNAPNPNWLLRSSGLDRFPELISGSDENYIRMLMTVEVCRQIVITAIALKRYQLRHGNLPAQLSELAPELLPAIPRDPVDGKPLRYRRNADGTFLLYSIGLDGKDDGGDPTSSPAGASNANGWLNLHAHDWVWPQPATAAEIQSYYATPHK